MQFKSGKYQSSTFSKVLIGAAFGAAALIPIASWATITVTSVISNGSTQLFNSFSGGFDYPAFASPQAPYGVVDVQNGFSFVDLAADIDPNTGIGTLSTQNPGVVYFNIQSAANITDANGGVIAITAVPNPNSVITTAPLVPVASQNQVICGASGSNCVLSQLRGGQFGNYFYGVPYSGHNAIITVGVDVQAICRSFNNGGTAGTTPLICSSTLLSGTGTTPTVSTPINITFVLYNFTDLQNASANFTQSENITLPTAQDTSAPVPLTFANLPGAPTAATPSPVPTPSPTAICNLTEGNIINPLQSSAQIDGTAFSIAGDPINSAPGAIIATANEGTTVFDQVSGALAFTSSPGNSVPNFPGVPGGLFVFPGFQNSTDPKNPILYRIGFLVRDYAGFVFDDQSGTNSGSCTFPGEFSTSDIQGFLNQNKCFIATAAFRMGNDGPIRLLREFRDRFLEQFSLGQSFVHWYYSWSPGAADWLIDHPVFRFPVLLALIPLQMVAWTILHPMVLGLLALLAVGLSMGLFLSSIVSRVSRKQERFK